jgi:rhamnogalacturonyl hydrolase YesR
LPDGTFVRGFPKRWTLWADDLYMGVPFLARMAVLTGDGRYFDDAARQVINFHRYLFDARTGLMTHNWYSEPPRPGVAFWGRANGWAVVAQVELLDRIPAGHPQRDTLLTLLRRHLVGLARYQGREGLWHQLLDRKDSYLETSASAMFTYAIAHAVNQGWLEPRYASIARRGWQGVASRVRPDGKIEGICTGTVVSDNLADYYQRPTPLNDVHGIGTVLLAGGEMLRLMRGTDR